MAGRPITGSVFGRRRALPRGVRILPTNGRPSTSQPARGTDTPHSPVRPEGVGVARPPWDWPPGVSRPQAGPFQSRAESQGRESSTDSAGACRRPISFGDRHATLTRPAGGRRGGQTALGLAARRQPPAGRAFPVTVKSQGGSPRPTSAGAGRRPISGSPGLQAKDRPGPRAARGSTRALGRRGCRRSRSLRGRSRQPRARRTPTARSGGDRSRAPGEHAHGLARPAESGLSAPRVLARRGVRPGPARTA